MIRSLVAAISIGLCLLSGAASADVLPAPTGEPILEIRGAISHSNSADGVARFDMEMLEALPKGRIVTSCPWIQGRPVFDGVPMAALLDAVGAKGKSVVVVALNDYKVEIPMEDFRKYPVIMAYKMGDRYLPIRAKGPLWIIYPQDEFPELKTKEIQSRWVWQIKELQIRN